MKSQIVPACWLMAAAGVLFLISGCSSPKPVTAQEANYPVDKIDAQSLFVENCATCHGKNGRAHNLHGLIVGAQNFANLEWQVATTDKQIIHAIQTGLGVMPAFATKLSPSEIEALAKYVRTFRTME
jgi:mono/diheme cytochrome c family protein